MDGGSSLPLDDLLDVIVGFGRPTTIITEVTNGSILMLLLYRAIYSMAAKSYCSHK